VDRTQRLLAIVLAAQIALLGILRFAFSPSQAAAKEQPLLPALASMTPAKLEIDDGTGASVAFERAGGAWTLENPKGYPTAAGKVEKVIEDVEHVSAGRPVVTNRGHHAALKVADDQFERRIRIWEKPDGKPSAELYVGSSPRFQVSHVRVGGKDPVYEASGLNSYDLSAEPAQWVDRNLITASADAVSGLAIRNAKGSFELEKAGGAWSVRAPAARVRARLDAQKVTDLVRTLCGMSLDAPAGVVDEKAQGLADPAATITLRLAPAPGDSTATPPPPVVVRIGAPVPGRGDQHYAARSGFGFAALVGKYSVDKVLDATVESLTAK
jgi:hypothetical protein